jgi:hypothetical protein
MTKESVMTSTQTLAVDHFIEHLVEGTQPSAEQTEAYGEWQKELKAERWAKRTLETIKRSVQV